MVVGLATVSLRLHEAATLKDKRSVVKRIVARLRARFNVAVAEVDDHDDHGVATLGIAVVSTEGAHARAMLEKAVGAIERERLDVDLFAYRVELL